MRRLWLAPGLLALVCASAFAGEPSDSDKLAGRIDRTLEARRAAAKLKAGSVASDAEFLRRVYLDLAGTIPSVAEVRAFLDDPSPDKRRKVINRLVDGPAYVAHFTSVWRSTWLPEAPGLEPRFEAWLRAQLARNTPYDRMVREMLTATPETGQRILRGFEDEDARTPRVEIPGADSFTLANENKPENLAGSSSRMFLAVRLECAQCHDHPFAEWKQEQFWQYAAFFAGRTEIAIPGAGKTVKARFPDGKEPTFKPGTNPRVVLADWATSPDNPYFARAAVNRVWAYFFGTGLVEPVDDMPRAGEKDELLDELAKEFAARKFDLRFLVRTIVSTRTYQLTSSLEGEKAEDARLFARMAVRGLTTEQVVASLMEATGYQAPTQRSRTPTGTALLRSELAGSFARQLGKPTEFQATIVQALALMNGKFVNDATSLERSGTLAAVANAPFLNTDEKIEALYLASLGRPPTPSENARLVKYVKQGGPSGDPERALADVFWALLNSAEFSLNH